MRGSCSMKMSRRPSPLPTPRACRSRGGRQASHPPDWQVFDLPESRPLAVTEHRAHDCVWPTKAESLLQPGGSGGFRRDPAPLSQPPRSRAGASSLPSLRTPKPRRVSCERGRRAKHNWAVTFKVQLLQVAPPIKLKEVPTKSSYVRSVFELRSSSKSGIVRRMLMEPFESVPLW